MSDTWRLSCGNASFKFHKNRHATLPGSAEARQHIVTEMECRVPPDRPVIGAIAVRMMRYVVMIHSAG
jgi:hypothetical protein